MYKSKQSSKHDTEKKEANIIDLNNSIEYLPEVSKNETNKEMQNRDILLIPALPKSFYPEEKIPRKRVGAYCRVSSDLYDQQSSFWLQVAYYTEYIQNKKE